MSESSESSESSEARKSSASREAPPVARPPDESAPSSPRALRPIGIVGGGLAGLTLGIALRRHDVPVTLFEAGRYPRHRVCGEFINGRGRDVLRELGLEALLIDGGTCAAREARTALFVAERVAGRVHDLPEAALCVSRFELDAFLARTFRELGGELREGERAEPADHEEGVVYASGRRVAARTEARWYGLKVHAHDVELAADLELHLQPFGYVGLCRLPDGLVNVCGLLRAGHDPPSTRGDDALARWETLRGVPGSLLRERMQGARLVSESACAVAGLDLRPRRATEDARVRVGDALTMIPPFTGNGMSMAFESAYLACEPLLAWARGSRSWSAAHAAIGARCDAAFARRLAWARGLQSALAVTWLHPLLVASLARPAWTFRALALRTR